MKEAGVENLMVRLGKEREQGKNSRAVETNQESTTPHGRQLLRTAVEVLGKAIAKYTATKTGPKSKVREQLSLFKPDVAALLISRVVIDSVSNSRTMTSAAFAVGRQLEDELRFALLSEEHPGLWAFLDRTKRSSYRHFRQRVLKEMARVGADFEPWSNKECIQLGVVGIELFAQETGLVKLETRRNKSKTTLYVVPTEETVRWLEEARKNNEELYPMYLPMTVPPEPWKDMWGGGYTTGVITKTPFIKPQAFSPVSLESLKVPEFHMEQVTRMQNTPWEINHDVLRTMSRSWDSSNPIADLPARNKQELPSKPHDIDTNPVSRHEYRKECAQVHRHNAEQASARILTSKHLYIANLYKHSRFWMPWFCDYRGRAYPRPHGVQPQGQQQARGLLYFADREPIDTPEQLAALCRHGANCFGKDKETYADRIQWVWENEDEIVRCASDPLEYQWWAEWDKPWEGLSFCTEFARFKEHGYGYESGLVCSVDASNSGHQIYSLLLRDEEGAIATNVLSSERPQDLYRSVADKVTSVLKREALEGHLYAGKWLSFMGGQVMRAATKRITMVIVYSAKMYSALEYVAEWYRDELKKNRKTPFEKEAYKECAYLAGLIWEAVESTVEGARVGMDWLRQIADICTNHKIPVRWMTPSGFEVVQASSQTAATLVRTRCGANVVRRSIVRDATDTLHAERQRTGICPNFIHSLDAAAKMRTVDLCYSRGVRNFAMVHDSYGTTAASMPIMEPSLRHVFADIFRDNQLEAFKREVESYLPAGVSLPDVPEFGTLNPEAVIDSPYFFS